MLLRTKIRCHQERKKFSTSPNNQSSKMKLKASFALHSNSLSCPFVSGTKAVAASVSVIADGLSIMHAVLVF